jgi:hypothetical protein
MRHPELLLVLAVTLVGSAGCRMHNTAQADVFSGRALDQPAMLYACSEPIMLDLRGDYASITVRYIVEPDGRVDRATVTIAGAADPAVTHQARDRLRSYAASCVYRPAMKDGVPVRSHAEQTLTVR